jgi:cytochrome c553
MEAKELKLQKIIVGVTAYLLIIVLIIVSAFEVSKSKATEQKVDISGTTKKCVDCHISKGVAVKLIDEWKLSKHAQQNIGCYECHKAEKDDWDAFKCPESDIIVAKHPTPKDCAECHEQQVKEFMNSKHAIGQMVMKAEGAEGPDRAVFEPLIATKHGCEQCHNIGNYWPDGSVGECDACHSKHQFSVAQARRPETCGECHIGPDHPHIEIFMESKHGNIYASFSNKWDWNYKTGERVPFNAPTCATCHMSAAPPAVKSTHNVSERLAWESQSPFSVRTSQYWGNKTWQEKREQMLAVCKQCHSRSFAEKYMLIADLNMLQYNEIWKTMVDLIKKFKNYGLIITDEFFDKDLKLTSWPKEGYDEEVEHLVYKTWHHEGRRFRHGAIMMGADFTQWHGIWDLQENLVKLMNKAAEHGIPEAKRWVASKDPNKFFLYPLYDVPGNPWGISSILYKGKALSMNRIDGYWEKVYANVKSAYEKGFLSEEQWKLYQELYKNKDKELGLPYEPPDILKEHMKVLADEAKYVRENVAPFTLPSKSPYYTTSSSDYDKKLRKRDFK